MKNFCIWNVFIQLKNAQQAKKSLIKIPRSNFCIQFLDILWNEGFILGYKVDQTDLNTVCVFLKYSDEGTPIIKKISFISKRSKRIYFSLKELWKINSNIGLVLISTNKGVLSLSQSKKLKVGGEPFVAIK